MGTVEISMIVNVHSRALMVLIDHLAARGLIDRETLSAAFRDCAVSTHSGCADDYPGAITRLDVLILKALADQTYQKDFLKSVYRGEEWSQPSND